MQILDKRFEINFDRNKSSNIVEHGNFLNHEIDHFQNVDTIFCGIILRYSTEPCLGAQTNLSVDEIVNCSDRPPKHRPLTIDAFGYMRRQGVAVQTSDCSLSPPGKVCRGDEEQERKYIRHYYLVNPQDDQTLMVAVALMGPLSVSIKVTENFFFYQKGVFYDPACNDGRRATNHAVLLVGYGTDENGGDFWIIKNSWGPRWGQQGFARMARNAVIDCEVTSAPIYPILKIPV